MDDLVIYDGQWMPLSKAAALARGEAVQAEQAEPKHKERRYTLAEALALEHNQQRPANEEPPALCAPSLDQRPLGKPIAEGTLIQQPVRRGQTHLPLQPIERGLTKDEQAAFSALWAGIDQEEARSKETSEKVAMEMAEAARWGLPYPVPTEAPLPADVFLLCDAAKLCGYQNQKCFNTFLRTCKYPRKYKVISQWGCEELLKRKRAKRRAAQAASKSKSPAKQVPEPENLVPKGK